MRTFWPVRIASRAVWGISLGFKVQVRVRFKLGLEERECFMTMSILTTIISPMCVSVCVEAAGATCQAGTRQHHRRSGSAWSERDGSSLQLVCLGLTHVWGLEDTAGSHYYKSSEGSQTFYTFYYVVGLILNILNGCFWQSSYTQQPTMVKVKTYFWNFLRTFKIKN